MTHYIDWHGCYKRGWKGEIVPAAFEHPAKYSRNLISRIYEYLLAEGLIRRGDKVVDPFGGVALGALDAMRLGLDWTGCELEEKFYHLGQGFDCPGFSKEFFKRFYGRAARLNYQQFKICPDCLSAMLPKEDTTETQLTTYRGLNREQYGKLRRNLNRKLRVSPTRTIPSQAPHRYSGNIERWQVRYAGMPNIGTARLLNGDSRNLAQVIALADCAVSSPPYTKGAQGHLRDFKAAEEFARVMSERDGKNGRNGTTPQSRLAQMERDALKSYGDTAGNLGNMNEGNFAAALSSPPYAHIAAGAGGLNTKPAKDGQQGGRNPNSASQSADQRYGDTKGQLSGLPEGDFQVAVSSPPYEEARIGEFSGAANVGHNGNYGNTDGQLGSMAGGDYTAAISSPPYEKAVSSHFDGIDWIKAGRPDRTRKSANAHYPHGVHGEFRNGDSEGNIGNASGETFWLASRTIIEQVYSILTPRGVAVWVVKDFVRNKSIVPFCDQWRQLCEAVGFETLYVARAWLVEEHGTQLAHDGNHKRRRTQRKSFFRRLHESKYPDTAIDYEQVIFMRKER